MAFFSLKKAPQPLKTAANPLFQRRGLARGDGFPAASRPVPSPAPAGGPASGRHRRDPFPPARHAGAARTRGRAWLTARHPATRSLPTALYLPAARRSGRQGCRREPDWLRAASPTLPGWRSSSRSPGKAFPRPGTWPPTITDSLRLASAFRFWFFFSSPPSSFSPPLPFIFFPPPPPYLVFSPFFFFKYYF